MLDQNFQCNAQTLWRGGGGVWMSMKGKVWKALDGRVKEKLSHNLNVKRMDKVHDQINWESETLNAV